MAQAFYGSPDAFSTNRKFAQFGLVCPVGLAKVTARCHEQGHAVLIGTIPLSSRCSEETVS
jgi:hypothetical protein